MTVRMPGGRVVVVDAKTPLDAFLASIEAEGDEARAAELARHGRHLREHVKRLATRAYAEQIKGSADFAILFLPNESFLYAALESQPDIMEFALEKKILIATPPTLIGLLKVIRFGWNEERVARNAEAIAEAGRKLHKRLASFVEAFDGIGKHLDRARAEYETGAKRLQGQVLAQARKMEELGGIGTNEPEAAIALPHGDSPFLAQAPEASLAKAEAAASGL
jgi:DNA recombination protein RmuC